LRFIVDEDVPKSAADLLFERGHEVIPVEEVLLPGSDDHLIARWAHEQRAVVVTCNLTHFKRLLRRRLNADAGLLGLPQLGTRARLAEFIHLVEAEGQHLGEARRMWLEIRETTVFLGR
jgi:predicted nuclease of predicted toxin-antitoxin system